VLQCGQEHAQQLPFVDSHRNVARAHIELVGGTAFAREERDRSLERIEEPNSGASSNSLFEHGRPSKIVRCSDDR
jgi:hypothetical protein